MSSLRWIEEGLRRPGKTRSGLAAALGRQPSAITALLKGERSLKADEIPKVVEYLGIIPPHVAGNVPIIAQAGTTADGAVGFAEEEQAWGEAPMPPGGRPDTAAIELVGDALRASVAQEGSLVYYDAARGPPTPDMVGELCVVGLADGRILIKYLHPGRGPQLFDLESASAPTMRDAPVVWASLVTAIIPRPQARRMIQRPAPAPAARSKKRR